jgi:hypothetical protein
MADREFSTLASKLAASVPGCPPPTVIQYIRDSAIRVCERTLFWRYAVPLFNLQPGVHEYFYDKPSNTDVHVLFDALVNCDPLQKLTLEQALFQWPCWADLYSGVSPTALWDETSPGALFNSPEYNEAQYNGPGGTFSYPAAVLADASTPAAICQINPDKYIVLPLPDNDKVYEVRMFLALKPKRTATGMDEVVFNELEDVILHGALQHLLVLPNVSWSDRELAAYHAKQYVYHISERRARANLGNMRGVMTARMQSFGV